MTHFSYPVLDWTQSDTDSGYRRAFLSLYEGDTAWHPGSTKRVIHGPAEIEYLQAPDGGVDVYVTKPDEA
jgi:hypothetical protein